jgi:hypothetical protein
MHGGSGAVHRARQVANINDFLLNSSSSVANCFRIRGMSGADFSFSVQILIRAQSLHFGEGVFGSHSRKHILGVN